MSDDDSRAVLKDQDFQANEQAARMKAAAEFYQQTATPPFELSSGSSAFSSIIKTWSVKTEVENVPYGEVKLKFAQPAVPPSRADATSVEEACRRLRENDSTLTKLNLDDNNIGKDGAAALAEALKSNTTLQTLVLGYTNIGKEGATALAEALKSNTTLQELYLDNNNIGNDGASALAEALKSNTTLQKLSLGYNRIGKEGAAALAEALKSNTTMQTLVLWRNNIGNEGARELLQMLRKHNGTLTGLNLFNNEIDDETMDEIYALVKANKDGTRNPPPQPLKWEAEQLLTQGSTLYANKEYEAALGKYMEAKQSRPIQSAQTWIEIALCREQLFQFDEMASAANSCIGVDPTMPLGYYLLAVARSEAGNVTAALEAVETGLQRVPNDQSLVALKNSLGQQHIAPTRYTNGENEAARCLAGIANEERDQSEAGEHPTMPRGHNSFTVAHSNSKSSNQKDNNTVQPNKRKSWCPHDDANAPSVRDSVEPSLQATKRPRVEPPLIYQGHAVAAGRAGVHAGAAAVAALPPPPPPPPQQHNENDVASHTWAPTVNLPLYPLATSSRVIVADLANVTTQISKQLKVLEVKATNFNETATARLETPENDIMHLALWRTSDRPDGILVELQLREGRLESFPVYSRLILNAAGGETASAVVALHTKPQIALNAPKSSRPWHAVDWSKKSKHTVEGLIADAWRALVKRLQKEKLWNGWDKIKVVAYYREQFYNDLKRIHQAVSEGNEATVNENEKHLYNALQCLRRQSSDGRLEQLPANAHGLQFFGKYGRADVDALNTHIRDVRSNQAMKNKKRRKDTMQPLPTIDGKGTMSHASGDPTSARLHQEGNSKLEPTALQNRGEMRR